MKAGNFTFKRGDRVAYRREFLRSCGFYTGPIPFARGSVIEVAPRVRRFTGDTMGPYVVTVDWNDPEVPNKVLSSNLILVADLHKELA